MRASSYVSCAFDLSPFVMGLGGEPRAADGRKRRMISNLVIRLVRARLCACVCLYLYQPRVQTVEGDLSHLIHRSRSLLTKGRPPVSVDDLVAYSNHVSFSTNAGASERSRGRMPWSTHAYANTQTRKHACSRPRTHATDTHRLACHLFTRTCSCAACVWCCLYRFVGI